MRVNTRNGLFANEGYGGGVFNGNVAFGSAETSPRSIGGLGDYPFEASAGLGRSLDNDDSAYPYNEFSMPTQVLQSQINEQFRTPPIRPDICPIIADGFLGGETCGALSWLAWDIPSACAEHANMWKAPSFGKCPFIGYQTGDPCSAVNTIKTVQEAIGIKPDGAWGAKSQAALVKSGKSYCSFVASCTGALPPGVTCPGYDEAPIHVPAPEVTPAPIVIPHEPEPLPEPPKPKQMNVGALVVGGLLAAGIAAVLLSKQNKR